VRGWDSIVDASKLFAASLASPGTVTRQSCCSMSYGRYALHVLIERSNVDDARTIAAMLIAEAYVYASPASSWFNSCEWVRCAAGAWT
jgi:hypothetical protein